MKDLFDMMTCIPLKYTCPVLKKELHVLVPLDNIDLEYCNITAGELAISEVENTYDEYVYCRDSSEIETMDILDLLEENYIKVLTFNQMKTPKINTQ